MRAFNELGMLNNFFICTKALTRDPFAVAKKTTSAFRANYRRKIYSIYRKIYQRKGYPGKIN